MTLHSGYRVLSAVNEGVREGFVFQFGRFIGKLENVPQEEDFQRFLEAKAAKDGLAVMTLGPGSFVLILPSSGKS